MRTKIRSFARPAALGVTAAALVGALGIGASAWPEGEEPDHAERPAAASDSRAGLIVRGLMPALVGEYVVALERARIDGILQYVGALHAQEVAAEAAASASGSSGSSGSSGGSGNLASIRQCESGGNYGAVSSGGTYRGAYQFDQQTWEGVGGSGDPAAAPPGEQDYRAQLLYEQSGSSPWPNCG